MAANTVQEDSYDAGKNPVDSNDQVSQNEAPVLSRRRTDRKTTALKGMEIPQGQPVQVARGKNNVQDH
ncbi:hypothetical protein ACJ72_08844 [Emergomyces africanus]|uniref:Uncharacterized protein n=1 Tax=Emergomyces africanus TaxID=1955775 RepID=A0A1B7NJ77_9EURO|nr:hypothetical protein ACJ72_08844 [Emergomyces africanus]